MQIYKLEKIFIYRKNIKEPDLGDKLVFENEKYALIREEIYRRYITRRYSAEILDNSRIDIDKLAEEVYNKIKNREKGMEER